MVDEATLQVQLDACYDQCADLFLSACALAAVVLFWL
jgi:hypothetical protein